MNGSERIYCRQKQITGTHWDCCWSLCTRSLDLAVHEASSASSPVIPLFLAAVEPDLAQQQPVQTNVILKQVFLFVCLVFFFFFAVSLHHGIQSKRWIWPADAWVPAVWGTWVSALWQRASAAEPRSAVVAASPSPAAQLASHPRRGAAGNTKLHTRLFFFP